MTYESDESLGLGFWLKVFAVIAAGGLVAIIIFFIFSRVWYTWSLLGAMIVLFVVLLIAAYIHDRREQRRFGADA